MDFYETLGVGRTASFEDISQAYRKLAVKYHPDVNPDPGAGERFKEVAEAFETLCDTNKRARYNKDHPEVKPKKKTAPKKTKKYEGPRPNVDYRTPRAPTFDIWGRRLTPEERKRWEIEAAVEAEDIVMAKKRPMNNPEAVKRWVEMEVKRKKAAVRNKDGFFDAFENQYTRNSEINLR